MINPRLEELRGKFQENPRRYFAPYANELRKAGDPAQAIAVCRTHLAGQPGHVSGHIVLGQALYEAGESGEARDIFTASLELDPENLIALRSLGEIAQINGEFDAARQWYQRLLDADPRNIEVAQLIRDIPIAPVPKPIDMAPLAEPAHEPTPFTIREEVAAAEAPPPEPVPPAPSFHTSFTGPGRAYKTAEDLREEAEAREKAEAEAKQDAARAEETDDAFVDLQPTAHDQGDSAPGRSEWERPAESEPEMVELAGEAEGEPMLAEAESSAPDESFEFIVSDHSSGAGHEPDTPFEREEDTALTAAFDAESDIVPEQLVAEMGFEAQVTESYPASNELVEAPLEIEDFAGDALNPESSSYTPPSEAEEPARATFAERGFDSAVEEDTGWMTTPSASLSDLEAAPEDWLEEQTHEVDVSTEASAVEAGVTEATGAEPSTSEATVDQTTDSWFDEVPGANAIEATEVTPDELWLPPELPQFTSPEGSARSTDEPAQQPAEEPSWSASLDEEQPVGTPSESFDSSYSSEGEPSSSAELHEAEESTWSAARHEKQIEETPDEHHEVTTAETAMDVHAESGGFDVQSAAGASEAFEGSTESSSESGWSPADAMAEGEAQSFEGQDSVEVTPVFTASSAAAETAPPSGDAIGHTPEAAIPAPTPAPFITETLAELYLQQGFRDEALSIYRQLLDRNPDDDSLKSRVAAIEGRETPMPVPVNAEIRAASQSVRTFFSRLAKRPAVTADVSTRTTAASAGEPEVPFTIAASALANLFSASKAQQSDEGAAATLAGAFSDPAGRPSRAAERELSLDHLFRDVPPGGTAQGGGGGGGGVTLDEFYSNPGASTGSSTEPGSESGPEESGGTDIRQFTAWLEGLRKK